MNPQRVKAVLFDLDDTLYEERDFFRGGFAAVADLLVEHGVPDTERVIAFLEHAHHNEGRAGVFQKLARRFDLPDELIPIMVSAFRAHRLDITLPPDVPVVLPRLRRHFRLGCVSDGWLSVQSAKIDALGVREMLDAIVLTDVHGRDFWKPHPRAFLDCCRALGVAAREAIFVGDNLERDFLGARASGMRFVRMRRRGCYFGNQQLGDEVAGLVSEVQDLYELERLLAGDRAAEFA